MSLWIAKKLFDGLYTLHCGVCLCIELVIPRVHNSMSGDWFMKLLRILIMWVESLM